MDSLVMDSLAPGSLAMERRRDPDYPIIRSGADGDGDGVGTAHAGQPPSAEVLPPCGNLVVLDRDGVINKESPDYVRDADQWHPLPGSLEAIARLHAAGRRIVVVTNQSGIGRGLMSAAAVGRVHDKMIDAVARTGGRIAGIYYCPHRPDQHCECRKPGPGLLRRIERDFGCSLQGATLAGDKRSDLNAARAVGARPVLVLTGYGRGTHADMLAAGEWLNDVTVHADLASLVDELVGAGLPGGQPG